MYNNSCGGGNRGNFRGSYRDNTRHSHGGQNYGRDSLGGSGRHSYGGSGGNFGRDFGPPRFIIQILNIVDLQCLEVILHSEIEILNILETKDFE